MPTLTIEAIEKTHGTSSSTSCRNFRRGYCSGPRPDIAAEHCADMCSTELIRATTKRRLHSMLGLRAGLEICPDAMRRGEDRWLSQEQDEIDLRS